MEKDQRCGYPGSFLSRTKYRGQKKKKETQRGKSQNNPANHPQQHRGHLFLM